LQKLQTEFGHFFQHETAIARTVEKINQHISYQYPMVNMRDEQAKDTLVLEINRFYRLQANQTNNMRDSGAFLSRLLDPAEQYKAKWATLRMLKFDPFAMRVAIVSWPKNTQTNFCFYRNNTPYINNNYGGGYK
jgi:hypothetical protein